MIYNSVMKALLFLIATLSFAEDIYQLSPLEVEAVDYAFGKGYSKTFTVVIVPPSDMRAENEIAYYWNNAIYLNRAKIKVFRSTFSVVHEATHKRQEEMNIAGVYTTSIDDYLIHVWEDTKTSAEQQAEAVRILAIWHLGIDYEERLMNDQVISYFPEAWDRVYGKVSALVRFQQ